MTRVIIRVPFALALCVSLLCVSLLAVAAPASAQGSGSAQGSDSTGEHSDRRGRALLLLDESAALYDQGRFLEAADMLRRAHELFPEPSLLYNLGRALESAGDEEGALDAYRRYLEAEPATERRAQVESRVAILERQLLEGPTDEGGGGSEGQGLAPHEQDPQTGEPDGPSLLGPVVLLAAGGAAIIGGVAFGAVASSRQDDALAPGVSMEDGAAIDDEAHSLATVANVLFVVGGVAAAAGVGWLLLGGGDEATADRSSDLTVRLELGPSMARLRGHF